jgi:hypothetical protein
MQQRTWGSIGGLPVLDVLAAVALSTYAVLLTGGAIPTGYPGSVGASVGVLALTAPVAWRRRWPVAAAVVLAVGAVVNPLVFGPTVRCGAALPAVFLVGYAVASRLEGRPLAIGLGCCALNVVAQCISDPRLGAPVVVLMLPALIGFVLVGRLVRSRDTANDLLRVRSAELRPSAPARLGRRSWPNDHASPTSSTVCCPSGCRGSPRPRRPDAEPWSMIRRRRGPHSRPSNRRGATSSAR